MSSDVIKKCACGVEYTEIPATAVIQSALYWFDCSCGSTLTLPTADFENYLRGLEKARLEKNFRDNARENNIQVMRKYNLRKPAAEEVKAEPRLRLVK